MVCYRLGLSVNDNDPDRFALRIAMVMLAAVVGSEVSLILGRWMLCAIQDGCTFDEFTTTTEMLSGLLATLIALVFALTKGPRE